MPRRPRTSRRPGFSMIEAVICIGLIGIALVAAMRTVGASARAQTITQRQAIGTMLAQDLMAEILAQEYEEPEGYTLLLTEINDVPGQRSTYDDVDDYDGWSNSPPKDRSNVSLTDYTGWRRTVEVKYATASNLDGNPLVLLGDPGVKRIIVRVYHGSYLAAELRAVKTKAWSRGEVGG